MSLAQRLGLSPRVQESLDHVYERWDGHGPGAVGGEALHLPARVSHVVDVVEIAARSGGLPAVLDVVRRRAGTHFDPAIAAVVERRASDLLDGLDDADMLEAVLAAEPPPHPRRPASELEALARAIADFADLKSPWTLGHSPAVAELAAAAAGRGRSPGAADRRAAARPRPGRGPERDLGQGRPARPRAARARAAAHVLHRADPRPHAGVRRLRGRSPAHRASGSTAAAITARSATAALSAPMRLLGVADAYVAMTSARPHRPALRRRGRGRAAAPGGRRRAALPPRGRRRCSRPPATVSAAAPPPPCGLTEREVEVLALLAPRPDEQADRRGAVPLAAHGAAPRRAHLRQDRPPHPRGRGDVRDGAPAARRERRRRPLTARAAHVEPLTGSCSAAGRCIMGRCAYATSAGR